MVSCRALAQTGEIVAHILTDKDVGDISAVPALLATVEGPIGSVIADGVYDGASVYEAAAFRQHDPPPHIVIPLRASSMLNVDAATPPTVRDRHVQLIAEKGCMACQKVTSYGRRSLVETASGRYKHVIDPKLRGKRCGSST